MADEIMLATVRELQRQLAELYAAINPDGTLTEHSQYVDTARDGANAIETTADYEERREDTLRLDWLMKNRTSLWNSEYANRQAIDTARKAK